MSRRRKYLEQIGSYNLLFFVDMIRFNNNTFLHTLLYVKIDNSVTVTLRRYRLFQVIHSLEGHNA